MTLFQRNTNIQLRWRQDDRNCYDLVRARDYDNPMAEALARASEIDREITERSATGRAFRRATVREAVESYLAGCEASPECSGATTRKYAQELARVVEFAESTREGRRCRFLDQVDSAWCEAFVRWLGIQRPTPRGRRIGGDASPRGDTTKV